MLLVGFVLPETTGDTDIVSKDADGTDVVVVLVVVVMFVVLSVRVLLVDVVTVVIDVSVNADDTASLLETPSVVIDNGNLFPSFFVETSLVSVGCSFPVLVGIVEISVNRKRGHFYLISFISRKHQFNSGGFR